jgi:hypothetical protein
MQQLIVSVSVCVLNEDENRGVLENTAFLCTFMKRPSLSVKTSASDVAVVVDNTKHDLLI